MATAPDSAPAPAPNCLHCFQVTADLCPQVLLRILGLVAQHTLIPHSVVLERHEDRIDARIAVDGLSPERAEILLAKISTIVTVREAILILA
jgi:hypothetical protein